MDAILLQKHPLKHFRAEAIVRLRRAVLRNLLCKPLGGGGDFFSPLFHPPKHLFVRIASQFLAHSVHSLTSTYFGTSALNLDLEVTVETREATLL